MKKLTQRGVLIRCCLLIGGALGMISNCMGIYFTPMADAIGSTVGKMSVMTSLVSLLSAFFAPVFVSLQKKFSIRQLISFGVILGAISFGLMSITKQLYVLYLCAALAGIGMCCFAILPVSILLRSWYGEKNGSALGIALAFSGVMGALMNPFLSRLITNYGYQFSLRFMALFLLVIVLPCALTIDLNPDDPESHHVEEKKEKKEKILVPTTLLVFLFVACMSYCFNCSMNQHFTALAQSLGNSLAASSTVMTFCMLGNIFFKVNYGRLCDRYDVFNITLIWLCIAMTGTLLILVFGTNNLLLRVGAFLYGAFFSLSTVALSMTTQKIAGHQYSIVYSRLSVFTQISYAAGVTIMGSIYDMAGSYNPALMTILCSTLLGLILTVLLKKKTITAA